MSWIIENWESLVFYAFVLSVIVYAIYIYKKEL